MADSTKILRPVNEVDGRSLAGALPDTPQTVISISQLRRGVARAYVVGTVHTWETAVVDDPGQPGEPMAFGQNPGQIMAILEQLDGWFCINVTPGAAPQLGPLLGARMGSSVRYYGDVYHTLTRLAPVLHHPAVRQLTTADLPLLAAAPESLRGCDPGRLLAEKMVVGAIIDGRIVAIAQNYGVSPRYGDVGVYTLPAYRGRGLASAAASWVARWLQENGRVPVWSCGEDNWASLRIAQKLGFRRDSERVYIILEKGKPA